MQVGKNKVVAIDYKLTDAKGAVIDSSANHGPLYYIQGIGNLIPGLEKELEGKNAGDNIKVTIQDQGIGIPQDKLEYIFDRFKQLDGSTTRKYGGTGLGLTICKELISLLNGKINVFSELNVGSTFEVIIPKNIHLATNQDIKDSQNENEENIYFSNIWYEYNKREKIGIKNIFNKSENLALRGLYLISKDLFDDKQKEFFEVLEPEAQAINDIRNHLEHKFISIKLFNSEFLNNEDRKRNFSISQDELEEKTIHLAQLVREAIIYLSFAVNIEEKKKNSIDELLITNSLSVMK
jgi:hypothetical protein